MSDGEFFSVISGVCAGVISGALALLFPNGLGLCLAASVGGIVGGGIFWLSHRKEP